MVGNLDDVSAEALMKKKCEDVINKWKTEVERHLAIFNQTAEFLRTFELNFQGHFEYVI